VTRRLTPLVLAAVCCLTAANLTAQEQPASGNLVSNPGLEPPAQKGLPDGWSAVVIGAPAQLAVDAEERHEGRLSVRITAAEVARSYVRSEPIEVAPGEKLRIGAWVKTRGVPADKGTVIAIADFTTSSGMELPAMKVGTANPAAVGWQQVSGTLTAPPLAVRLHLRLGFSYSLGTCWWDDVTVRAERPLVARIDLPSARLSPAMGAVPVTILNRGARKAPVSLTLSGAGGAAKTEVALTGARVQEERIPLKILKRGRGSLSLALGEPAREEPVFTESRAVTVPPPLTLAPLIPTHWVIEDGPAQLRAEIALEVSPDECRGSSLSTRIVDSTGAVRATLEIAEAAPGTARQSLTVSLQEGSYRVEAEFRPAEGPPIKAEQPWAVIPRRKASVRLNAAGYLEQDGRAVFPLGLFNGGARMAEAGAAGFTVSHAYNAVRVQPGQSPDDQRAKDFLDATEKAGMRALFLVPMPWAVSGDWESFRRRIRMFRNHPGLLAWDEEEGLARGDLKPETLLKLRQVLREEDPHHPLMVGDSRDVIGRVTDRSNFFPVDVMDLGMWWWYPIPLAARPPDALQGEDAAKGGELVPPSFLTQRNTAKPLWVGVQAYKKPQPTARYPNAAEYRAQAYLALIHGAKGLMWYGGSVTGGLFLSPKEGDWDSLKGLARELNGLSQVLMAPPAPLPAVSSPSVSAAMKSAGGRRLIFAVNRSAATLEVTLRVPASPTAAVVIGEGRSVTVSAGEIRDRFGPYATHVYELGVSP